MTIEAESNIENKTIRKKTKSKREIETFEENKNKKAFR